MNNFRDTGEVDKGNSYLCDGGFEVIIRLARARFDESIDGVISQGISSPEVSLHETWPTYNYFLPTQVSSTTTRTGSPFPQSESDGIYLFIHLFVCSSKILCFLGLVSKSPPFFP